MKFKNFTLLMFFLLNINFEITPKLFQIYNNINYEAQFKDYLSLKQNEELKTIGYWSTAIVVLGAICYAGDIYFKETDKVGIKYPDAQKWYDAMHLKYPQAHFDQKQFLQTSYTQTPAFYNIYFSHDSLQQINTIYKKKLENK